MTTARARRQRAIERITNRISGISDLHFDGDHGKGFLFWATDLHLDQTDDPPTEEILLGNLTDGPGDLELDAYHVDDSSGTIYLFQSKYRAAPANLRANDFAGLLDVPRKLTTPALLADLNNENVLDFARRFRQHLLDGYDLQLVYVTTMKATQPLRRRASSWADEPLSLQVGGESVDTRHSAVIVDIDDLIQIIDSLEEPDEIELTLRIRPSSFHQSTSGSFRCLIASLPLLELARTFDEHRYAIFRYNPRGPLGSVAVNKDIRDTLADDDLRELFQLMNNGLSALCTSFTDPINGEQFATTTVRDFQIVNGCQTTYTVWDHYFRRAGELGQANVTLKLVEAEAGNLRHLISSSSNRQSQMKDWDFLFDDPLQQRLQNAFASLNPPVFYELRRGEHKYMAGGQPQNRAQVKDIAQAAWAFMGHPGEAKDRLREIPRSKGITNGAYNAVFFAGVDAEQLRLPWVAYRKVQAAWKDYSSETGNRSDEREHGRLHILWLIGRSLVKSAGFQRYQSIPLAQVRQFAESIDDWFPIHHDVAVDTVREIVRFERAVAERSGDSFSLRQLFRSSSYYKGFRDEHDRRLEANAQLSGSHTRVA